MKIDIDILEALEMNQIISVGGGVKVHRVPNGYNYIYKFGESICAVNVPCTVKKKKKVQGQLFKFDFRKELINLGVDEEVASAWMEVRKLKKATNSEIAFKAVKSEIEKASLSANDCIKLCVIESWKGFKVRFITEEHTKLDPVEHNRRLREKIANKYFNHNKENRNANPEESHPELC